MTKKNGARWALLSGLDIGADGDPYLDRLRIIQTPLFGVYLHHIHRPDKDPDPHDHPWAFASLVLSGSYDELVWPDKHDRHVATGRHRARWSLRRMTLRRAHIITSVRGPLWTLVLVGPSRGEWGFWTKAAGYVPWRQYVSGAWIADYAQAKGE